LFFAEAFEFQVVGGPVGLCPWAVHGGAFALVEQAEVDADGIDSPAHRPA